MPRGKKTQVNGEIPKPDYALAASILRNDINPAKTEQGRAMKDASDAYKAVKKEAHVHPWAVRQVSSLMKNEDAERDIKLRDLRGMLIECGLSLRPDLVDLAQGVDADDEVDVIPIAASAKHDSVVALN